MDTIHPHEREAILAALAAPRRQPYVPAHARQDSVLHELRQLANASRRLGVLPGSGLPKTPPQRPAHWPNCHHTNYHLTCAEYEMLHKESGGFCDLCRADFRDQARPLQIDHDHALGWRAVRGLICQSCNQRLASVDAGVRRPGRDTRNYLSDPWHLRVGLGSTTCPPDCGDSAHRVTRLVTRFTQELRGPTQAEQRSHLLAQLRSLS